MKTNITTIYNLIAATKSNGAVAAPKKNHPADEQPSEYEMIASHKTTDKNGDKTNAKTEKDDNPKFNGTFHEKTDSKTQSVVHKNKTDKKEKRSDVDKPTLAIAAQEAPAPSGVIYEKDEKKGVIDQTENAPLAKISEKKSAEKLVPDSSIEKIADGSKDKNVVIIPETDSPADIGQLPTDTPPANNTKAAPKAAVVSEIAGDSGQTAVPESVPVLPESLRTVKDSGGNQQKITPENPVPGQNKALSEVDGVDGVERVTTEKSVNHAPETNTPGHSLPEKAISNLKEKPAAVTQGKIAINEGQKPQDTVQPLNIPERTDPRSQTEPAQAVIHRMNAAMKQTEPLKLPKQQNPTEKMDSKTAVKADGQIENGTVSSPDMEKPPVLLDSIETVINKDSKLSPGHQIQESVSHSYRPGTQQIVIRLDPPDLGRVTIKFVEQHDGITGILHVDKPDTQHDIQQALPGIVQNLQNSGIQIKKMEVALNNLQQHQNTAGENPTGHNGGFGQQNTYGQNTSGQTASYRGWSASSNSSNHPADSQIELTDKSINILI